MSKILKNTSISAITINDVGKTIAVSENYTIPEQDYFLWAASTQLDAYITSGDIVVNDGINDITVANGFSLERAKNYIKYPDKAFNMRFEAEPERSNNFTAKNVQEAIEEAKVNQGGIKGRTFTTLFYNNGNTSNKWLFHLPTNEASDSLPFFAPFDLEIYGVGFSNKNLNIDCDVEVYLNGTAPGNKVHTVQVRDSRFFYDTTTNFLFNAMRGDEIAVYIKKFGATSPASVEVDLYCRIYTNNVGTAGEN